MDHILQPFVSLPFGVQSLTSVVGGRDGWCRISAKPLRISAPVATSGAPQSRLAVGRRLSRNGQGGRSIAQAVSD